MLESLFAPETIAVIGVNSVSGEPGYDLVHNLIGGGFRGTVVPIGKDIKELAGLKCYGALKDYGKRIDLCLITLPATQCLDAVEVAVKAKAKVVVIVSAGFMGEAGAQLKTEMAEICKNHNSRLLGPGSLGIINTYHNMNASLVRHLPDKGTISVFSQSGVLCSAILDSVGEHTLGLSKMVGLGEKADITEIDLLDALAEDAQTKVIAGYLESIESGDAFVKVAEVASSNKPVVILKAGTTEFGARAARRHIEGSMGTDMAYGAAFKRSGVIRAETFDELLDFALVLSTQPLPTGNNLAIITNTGGAGVMASDAVDRAGLVLATLSDDTRNAMMQGSDHLTTIHNPVDLKAIAQPASFAKAIDLCSQAPEVDGMVILLAPSTQARPTRTAASIVSVAGDGKKPVVTAFMGGEAVASARRALIAAGIPEFGDPTRAVRALEAVYDYAAWRRRPPRVVTRFPVNKRRVERIINRHVRTGRAELGELASKEILAAYQFNIPDGKLVATAEEAVIAAERIGFPVALKISSPDIVRKSPFGGVKLNLFTPDHVRDAFDLMVLRIKNKAPQARLEGVYVEKMSLGGREVTLGMQRDPQFGPMLMFGLGGIFVEVMKDVAFHLAPITADEAMQMLENTRSYEMLTDVGGREIDLMAIAGGIQRISQLATDFPQIIGLDINPFIVGPAPDPAMVVDAGIIMSTDEVTDA